MMNAHPARPTRAIATAVLAGLLLATRASATYIAGDSYTIGTNPAAGQYASGVALKSQSTGLVTPGFTNSATGAYGLGSGTSNFIAQAGGLSTAGYNTTPAANDGNVEFTGAAADNTVRSVARAFSAVPSSTTYFFNILVSQNGQAMGSNGFALAGFGNSTVPLLGTTSNEVQGLYFGFAQDGTSMTSNPNDLVIRYRNGMDTTADAILVNGATTNTAAVFNIVAELTVSTTGSANGILNYWVNPTNFTSTATLTATSLTSGALATEAYAPSGSPAADPLANFQRLTYTAENFTGIAKFDEARFGTTLADVAPAIGSAVPEPASVVLMGLGLLCGLGVAHRRRAVSGR